MSTGRIARARPLLGTRVDVRVDGLNQSQANAAIDAAFAAITDIHRLMSFHEAASDVSRLNRDAARKSVAVDARTFTVLRRAAEIAAASGGVFDVCTAATIVAWGFLPRPDAAPPPDPAASWRDIILESGNSVRFAKPLWIDLGGIAKGYAVDMALAAMNLAPGVQCVINAGGDLRVAGPASEQIALRLPHLFPGPLADAAIPAIEIPAIEIMDGSLASSSGHEHARAAGGRTVGPHVDGVSGGSASTTRFVSVAATECMVADALTKVVMAGGAASEPVLRRFGATAYLLDAGESWTVIGEENKE